MKGSGEAVAPAAEDSEKEDTKEEDVKGSGEAVARAAEDSLEDQKKEDLMSAATGNKGSVTDSLTDTDLDSPSIGLTGIKSYFDY